MPDATLPAPLEHALSLPPAAPPKSSQLTRLSKLCVTQRGAARAPARQGPGDEERALSWASSPAAPPPRQAAVSIEATRDWLHLMQAARDRRPLRTIPRAPLQRALNLERQAQHKEWQRAVRACYANAPACEAASADSLACDPCAGKAPPRE